MVLTKFSFDYLSDTNNLSQKDLVILSTKEFDRFVRFLQITSPLIKYELNDFLYPLYVFVFLVGVWGEQTLLASNFLSKHSKIFLTEDRGYRAAIQNLAQFGTLEDAENNPYFNRFWDSQFVIKISEESWAFMKRFLKEQRCRVLTYFVRFHIAVMDNKRSATGEEKLLKFTAEEFVSIQDGEALKESSDDDAMYIENDSTPKEKCWPLTTKVFDSIRIGENLEESSEKFVMATSVTDCPEEHSEEARNPAGNQKPSGTRIKKSKRIRKAPVKLDL